MPIGKSERRLTGYARYGYRGERIISHDIPKYRINIWKRKGDIITEAVRGGSVMVSQRTKIRDLEPAYWDNIGEMTLR